MPDPAVPAASDASDQAVITAARPGTHPVVEAPAETLPDTPGETDDDGSTGVVGLWALFLGLGLLMTGNGLNGSVIGIRSGSEGFSLVVTGVIMAGYFAGFLLGPTAVVRLVPQVGHIRVFAGLASTASSAVLVHSVIVEPAVWMLMRFVFGFCMAGLYVVLESWLNEMATTANRGRTLAVYMVVSMGGLAIGQLLIGVGDPNGFELFVLASVLVSMSLVPMALAATTKQPRVHLPERTTVRELLGYVPTGVISTFMNGITAGVVIGLAAVYAVEAGLSLDRTALFLAAPMVGAIVFQWPIGWVSDRVSRRSVIFVVAVVAVGLASILALVPADNVGVLGLMVLLGGAIFSLYSLVVAYTLDWTPATKTVAASGAIVRVNGTGAIVGPLLAAGLMAAFDEAMFFWTLVAANAVIVLYVGWRILFKDALPIERQRRFVTIPARASELVYRMAPRPRRRHRSG